MNTAPRVRLRRRPNEQWLFSSPWTRERRRDDPASSAILLTIAAAALAVWCAACAPPPSPLTTMEADSEAAWLIKSCDAGSAKDCNTLGVMYAVGREVRWDAARAAELYRKACDAGLAKACSTAAR